MRTVENFTTNTADKLAKRAGLICSFPNCGRLTSGPSQEKVDQTASTGEAAHICAASKGKGARRRLFDSSFDRSLLSQYSNGVWMCCTHAKLIDTDEVSYTVTMLNDWRRLAELRADLAHRTGKAVTVFLREGNRVPLAKVKCVASQADDYLNLVCNAVMNSCITDIWGKKLGISVRDFSGEVVVNEFKHGGATEFRIEIEENKVLLSGNGAPFSFQALLDAKLGRGGRLSATHLKKQDTSLLISYKREKNWNVTELIFISRPEEVLESTICSINGLDLIDDSSRPDALDAEERGLTECETVYVVIPTSMHFIPSISMDVAKRMQTFQGKKLVLVGSAISESVAEYFKEMFGTVEVIDV